MPDKEAKARIKINKLLEISGWRFLDNENGKANITLEVNVKINNIEKGYVDYLLHDEKGFPVAVLEAKSENKNPLDGKEQARKYAVSQNVRFVILSNGNLHYLWDLKRGNPNIITKFPSLESLINLNYVKPNSKSLLSEDIKKDYIVLTQKPGYYKDPRWTDEKLKEEYIKENNFKFLRDYQVKAVSSLQDSVNNGKDRFLFEMATGTGKTLVAAAIIKLFLRTGNARRVLFLVDRLELEDQAYKNFVNWLKNDFTTVIYKENKDEWKKAEIVVSTIQSFLFNNKYQLLFCPTDFDLIISDEAHRSISGNSRAVFEYFCGYKLGLTATPKDYLKNVSDKINEKDPRAWERRQLLDTYKTFGCESGTPTFRYSLIDGVKEGFLVNPIVIDARTEVTTTLLSEEGYSVVIENEEEFFYQKDFEKKFFSEETNKIFCKTFLENALKDPISGEIGKSIVFCVSQAHASKITQILNEFADIFYPNKYKSDFAVQVTSNIGDAQQHTINFSNNNLMGKTNFLEGYNSSKTRVCVTVGMMTTGYDCQDILNLCLMRPIFSPTDFVQIKGRGTRKYIFRYKDENEIIEVTKEKFKLFDFFANCEYFEEKYNYDEVLKLPKIYSGISESGEVIKEYSGEYENYNIDPLKSLIEKSIGIEGMKIDRMLFEKFEKTVKENSFIVENFEKGNLKTIENYILNEIFDKPDDYFNLDKLRKALKLDRRLSLREIICKVFGKISNFKTKDELLEEEFNKFILIHKPDNDDIVIIKNFFKAYITDDEVQKIIKTKEYSRFATNPNFSLSDFKELKKWRDVIPEYVKDYVHLNTYM